LPYNIRGTIPAGNFGAEGGLMAILWQVKKSGGGARVVNRE